MRRALLPLLGLVLSASASAQLAPEMPGVAALPASTPAWFYVRADAGAYIFDGDSGEMRGLITNENSYYTPAIVTLPERKEAYLVESFYSRGVRGERSDVVTVVNMTDLTPKAEIDVPDITAALSFRGHIGIMGDDRHLAVFNQNPSQSVSIVDVVDRRFVGEIATPGCAVMMPVGERDFLMICADGRLQMIRLDENGKEAGRSRSSAFFSVDEDAVFDLPLRSATGWVLVSRNGLVYEVGAEGERIRIAKPWSMVPEDERAADPAQAWRPGGAQVFAINRPLGLLYAVMHQGPIDTHSEPGTEVWVVDLAGKRRVARLHADGHVTHVLASQEEHPKLYVAEDENTLKIYDGLQLRLLRQVRDPGPKINFLQNLARND